MLTQTDLRWNGMSWCDDELALVFESWYKTRRSVWHTMAPSRPGDGKQVLFDRDYEDVYSDPGTPLVRKTENDTYVLLTLDPEPGTGGGRRFLMQGKGATPQGWRPFLDVFDLSTREKQRVWQCTGERYESIGSYIFNDAPDKRYTSVDGMQMLLVRETPRDPSQYHLFEFRVDTTQPAEPIVIEDKDGNALPAATLMPGRVSGTERQVTFFPHPYPTLKEHKKEVLRYTRDDGTELNATLYTPPGYDKERDGPLPCLLWAYPREFKTKDSAGQMRKSPYMFSFIGPSSPLLWMAKGFAVLDGPTMPIIGEAEGEEPNDRYVEQLTASARAAVEAVTSRGVVDPRRIAVGGHSYGAFMTANLLAHCGDLFACGIAQSGAYNRTLTPFGFQAEERTLWQAPDVYQTMSPFMHADKIKKPLLLIHGDDDNNPGTFPIQSERFYQALKGHGAPTRLVLLPHESHGYRARESVLHQLYEVDHWLENFCAGAAPEPETEGQEFPPVAAEGGSKL